MTQKQSFHKKERLTGEIRIAQLFEKGKSNMQFPLRLVYRFTDEDASCPVRVLISVPKKKVRKAHDRNCIKRLIRETYRKNKHDLANAVASLPAEMHLAFVFVGDEIPTYAEMEKKMMSGLNKLTEITSLKKSQKHVT